MQPHQKWGGGTTKQIESKRENLTISANTKFDEFTLTAGKWLVLFSVPYSAIADQWVILKSSDGATNYCQCLTSNKSSSCSFAVIDVIADTSFALFSNVAYSNQACWRDIAVVRL